MSWNCNLRFEVLPYLFLLSSFLFFVSTSSGLVNVTVDDQFGDPITGLFPDYSPNDGTWHIGSRSEDCSNCYINSSILDLNRIYDQTWHDATYRPPDTPPTITVNFHGSAVYVFNILANTLPSTGTFTNISFSIDGDYVGTFIRYPEANNSSILYNQLVYSNATLNDASHTLTMAVGGIYSGSSLILFDYLVYTTQGDDTSVAASGSSATTPIPTGTRANNSSQSPSIHTSPVGSIIGGVVGGVALIGIAIGGFCLYRKRIGSTATTTSTYKVEHGDTGGGSSRLGHGVGDASLLLPSTVRRVLESTWVDDTMTHHSLVHPGTPGPTAHLARTDAVPGFQVAAAVNSESTLTAGWSSKRREELTQRLETLQHSRSALSSQPLPHPSLSGSHTGSGTENAIRDLEAEISQLRGMLSTLNERLADRVDGGMIEPLPGYVE